MQISLLFGAALALASTVAGFRDHSRLRRRQLGDDADPPEMIYVPTYNYTVPVDHFNSSDKRTFNNRYFVNDTFWRNNGPVIFYDFGESGVGEEEAAMLLAGWNNATSAVVELAKALNGLIIGWEHRYYGYSYPFPLNGSLDGHGVGEGIRTITEYNGIPLGGAADYKYLTVEQSLQDVVHFATNFNKTQLGVNNTVLTGANATQNLGPYHTPWIWVGGSYPGMRGAWMRLRNPEVFYAVWASSAPVESIPDGSAYFNSIYRGIPKNCSSDIQAVAKHADSVFTNGNSNDQLVLKTGAAWASGYESASVVAKQAQYLVPSNFTLLMFRSPLTLAQSYGIGNSVQKFCDYLESFNVNQFLGNVSSSDNNVTTRTGVFRFNDGKGAASDAGIMATHKSIDVTFAALSYAVSKYPEILINLIHNSTTRTTAISFGEDIHSWAWQVLAEIGMIPNFDASSPLVLGTKFLDLPAMRTQYKDMFASIPDADKPKEPNQAFPQSFKGWAMTPSNVMFTNGEFDPWRAFSVMSLDQDKGAPSRKVTQDIPKCGVAPPADTVFGLLYPGASHVEDILHVPGEFAGSVAKKTPVSDGIELFTSAYKAWLPCFNDSRTQPPPGANAASRPRIGVRELAIALCACVLAQFL